MKIWKEEIFGPVLHLEVFNSDELDQLKNLNKH